jgi:hypothetical protein
VSKSDYLESALLNHTFRTTAFTQPTNVYVSLHTADPTDAGTGTEVSGGSYARVEVSRANASWSAPANNGGAQEITNAAAVTFPSPTANWGTVTHFGIWDASTTGNLLYHGSLTTSRTINNGDSAPSFAIGALAIRES